MKKGLEIRLRIAGWLLLAAAGMGVTACWGGMLDPLPLEKPEIEAVTAEMGADELEVVISCRVSRMDGIKECGILFGEEELRTLVADTPPKDNVFSVSVTGLRYNKTYHYQAYIDGGRSKAFSEMNIWKTKVKEVYETDGVVTILLPPANEVWYESHSGETIPLAHDSSLLVSNTYTDGKGIYRFSQDLTSTDKMFDYSDQCLTTKENEDFKTLILPEKVSQVGQFGLSHLCKATTIVLPYRLASVGSDFLCRFGEWTAETSHIYFIGEIAPSSVSTSIWNMNDQVSGGRKIDYFHYPENNSTYNSLLQIRLQGNATHYWVPTKYEINFAE